MSLTRLYNYLAGSLAKGEEVSAEYDSIIAFCNSLETDKLDVTGGTVSNLTVSGAFITAGANTFNGASAVNADVTIASTKKIIAGTGVILNNAGVMDVNLDTGGTVKWGSLGALNKSVWTLQSDGAEYALNLKSTSSSFDVAITKTNALGAVVFIMKGLANVGTLSGQIYVDGSNFLKYNP